MTLINFVAEKRKANKLTQEDLAQRVGVTRRTIISLEKGNYSPSLTLGLLLAQALNTDINDLFVLEEES